MRNSRPGYAGGESGETSHINAYGSVEVGLSLRTTGGEGSAVEGGDEQFVFWERPPGVFSEHAEWAHPGYGAACGNFGEKVTFAPLKNSGWKSPMPPALVSSKYFSGRSNHFPESDPIHGARRTNNVSGPRQRRMRNAFGLGRGSAAFAPTKAVGPRHFGVHITRLSNQ